MTFSRFFHDGFTLACYTTCMEDLYVVLMLRLWQVVRLAEHGS